jgi:hypothetical protein
VSGSLKAAAIATLVGGSLKAAEIAEIAESLRRPNSLNEPDRATELLGFADRVVSTHFVRRTRL